MLTVLEGNNFLVADDQGDVGSGSEGLYYNDTRYLSSWRLLLNGEPPQLLSSGTVDYYSAAVFLQNPATPTMPAGAVSLIRDVFVGEGGMQNGLHVENHLLEPVELELRLEFDFDFLDLFEVKAREYREEDLVFTARTSPDGRVETDRDEKENSWSFRLRNDAFRAQALVWVSKRGEPDERSITHRIQLGPGETWETRANVVLLGADDERRQRYTSFYFGQERVRVEESMRSWQLHAPELVTDWEELRNAYHRSLADLAALRMRPRQGSVQLRDLPAAGLPWFMTVFGRDTLITSYQTMLLGSNLAAGTLEALAALQAPSRDDERDSEPGKIVHEVRVGRVAAEGGAFPYYGSVDSTLLFLILLSELYRWTGDVDTIAALRTPAMGALAWMRKQGDLDGDGFIEYHRRSKHGLESQSWKDSWDSMRFHDGTVARTPIATAEVQGYAYDARLRTAELARRVWRDDVLASALEAEAATLRERFNADFFDEDAGYYVLGLDQDKRRIDSLCSNIGHLLWSGIVDEDRAGLIAEQLMSHTLNSGWGVRTMSDGDRGFNPIGYHTGTVWPHDNSLVMAGLVRYGYRQYANRIATSMLTAARHFDYRLPEVFAGYSREMTPFPVAYPTACSPQAWATGAPVLFMTCMLGLRPDPATGRLHADAVLPEACQRLELRGVAALGRRYDIHVRGGHAEVRESA
ncbi:MAG TPA: glycogen debranching N-terminal domain-containing protein [Gaiellales bacterium]|nr:glycogen debranching N-terminal domain-containing protein [Gaiellales bacterium]